MRHCNNLLPVMLMNIASHQTYRIINLSPYQVSISLLPNDPGVPNDETYSVSRLPLHSSKGFFMSMKFWQGFKRDEGH